MLFKILQVKLLLCPSAESDEAENDHLKPMGHIDSAGGGASANCLS